MATSLGGDVSGPGTGSLRGKLTAVVGQNFPVNPTAYQVLRVSADASQEQLRKAYRKAARTRHPDVGGDAEDFHLLTQAWKLVGTEDSRAHYDKQYLPASTPRASTRSTSQSSAASATARAVKKQDAVAHILPPLEQGPIVVDSPHSRRSITVDGPLTARLIHGEPPGGFFSARRRNLHRWLSQQLAPKLHHGLPATRFIHGLKVKNPGQGTTVINTVALCGDRIAVIDVVNAPPDFYQFNGQELSGRVKRIEVPELHDQVDALQEACPELTVGSFVVAKSTDDNPLAPQVKADANPVYGSGLTAPPAGVTDAVREMKMFFGTGPKYQNLDRELLGRLLLHAQK